MKIGEVMTRTVRTTSPDASLQEAARAMAEVDIGILPVGEGDKLVGMITDRDIAVRAVAQGKGPQTKVREAMTAEVSTASRTRRWPMSPATWRRSRCSACR